MARVLRLCLCPALASKTRASVQAVLIKHPLRALQQASQIHTNTHVTHTNWTQQHTTSGLALACSGAAWLHHQLLLDECVSPHNALMPQLDQTVNPWKYCGAYW